MAEQTNAEQAAVEEIQGLVERSRAAQAIIESYSQEQPRTSVLKTC